MPTTTLRLPLDRALPIPLAVQLSGLIRYGIACGEFRAGDRLPSVRDLAEEVGVAPMTVAAVYRDLKAQGLIAARPGAGTFIASRSAPFDRRLLDFHRRAEALVDEALSLGLDGAEVAGLLAARLSARQARGPGGRVLLVGLFAVATADYARAVGAALGPAVQAEATTLDALQFVPEARQRAQAADLVLTFAYLEREVGALLPGRPVTAISFTPAEGTRQALAALSPRARVLAVSRFPEFAPMMRAGLQRFAPQVAAFEILVLDAEDLVHRANGCDVVVYATGAEAVLDHLRPEVQTVEYRHSPDPGDIDRIVRPLLARQGPVPSARKEVS